MDVTSLCKCSSCPLAGRKIVPGEGTSTKLHYDIAFVGIAPAKTEVEQGRPLVGWSGTLLRTTLKKLGIEEFYLTNTMLCQLPDDISASDQNKAIECCAERLREELKLVNPKLVVAMGNVPLEALTGVAYKIRSVQGRILPGIDFPILPVIHPASLAKRSDEFYDYVDSLKAGKRYLDGTYQQAGIPKRVIVDEVNLPEVLQTLDNAELVAVDLETTKNGFFPYGRDPDKIRCACLAIDDTTAYIFPANSSPYFEPHPDFVTDNERLKGILQRKKLIFHNGPFDVGFLKQSGYKPSIFFDTFLAHYLTDERQYSHGLKDLAGKYLGAPDWEEDIKKYLPHKASSYDLIPDDALYEYAAYDVVYTYQLSEGQGFRKRVGETFPYKSILNPSANMFAEIRHHGLPIDVGLLMEMDSILEKELDEEIDELCKLANITRINPFSSQEVAELLYDTLGYPQIPGFGRSTAAKVLQLIGGDICQKIQEVREFGKLKSTYVLGLANFVDGDFRIHPFTKLHGTVTGRLSATDPSILNVHKKGGVRRLYLPEDGHLMLEADNKQMELRCIGIEAQDEFLKEALLKSDRGEGPDPHSLVNEELNTRTGKVWDRDKAKAGVFGVAYGRGEKDFILSYRMSREDASELIAIIKHFLPKLEEYNKRVKKEVHKTGVLTSYFGRKRRFGLVLDSNKHDCYRQGANFYIQSMASDINLLSMLHLWEMKDKWGIYPLFPVHDSIVMDIPSIDVVPEVKREIEKYSSSLVNNEMSFKVECSVGPSWGDAKKIRL
jgi:uracil-DNA glycosylase family 4